MKATVANHQLVQWTLKIRNREEVIEHR